MRRHSQPSTLAGATLLTVIALVFVLSAAIAERNDSDATAPPSTANPAVVIADGLARSLWTSNVRSAPRPDAEVVAVLPADREAALVARAGSGAWLLVAYPPDGPEGWLPAQRLQVDAATIGRLPQVTPPAPEATASADGSELPDLTITEIYVVPGNRLAFRLQNAGAGPLVQVALGLGLTVSGAEAPAPLTVEAAALEPGETAAVVTTVVLSESGQVSIDLDPDGLIEESNEENNSLIADVNLEESAP